MELDLEDWPCRSRDDCVSGYACNLATGRCQQVGSLCEDYDGDKIGNGAGGNPGCAHQAVDIDDTDPSVCGDTDLDSCEDCASLTFDPSADGPDTDGDGLCDDGDPDDDGDGVVDEEDAYPFDSMRCRDADEDACDDCSSGTDDPSNDGDDTDGDGSCNTGDDDDDGDTVLDDDDLDPLDNSVCRDLDSDGCDDCAVTRGPPDPANDGLDTDLDGACNLGDADDDDDTVDDGDDLAPLDRYACRDQDADGCDDCSQTGGPPDSADDGLDTDLDGACNVGDADDDDDGVDDGDDLAPLDRYACRDQDADTCDDCSSGIDAPGNDGSDTDNDGICDAGDACTDEDTDGLGNGNLGNTACVSTVSDSADNNPNVCADTDGDTCDDCDGGSFDPADDGDDLDGDGLCDSGDSDIDGDGVGNAGDPDDYDRFVCGDGDADTCDDCDGGSFDPANDGDDLDGDGLCNVGDPDIDGDGVGNAGDPDDFDSNICGDSDADACDDCSVTAGPPDTNNDGSDQDNDGVCDATDACTDQDSDGLGNGNLGNAACVNATVDSDDNNPNVCADTDGDTCNDCDGGSFDPADDGGDLDGDGLCDSGDPDIDGDGVGNASDPDDSDRFVCGDSDSDVCDDCSQTGGPPDAANDGTDTDGDGACDATDACTDQDTDGLGNGNLGNTACVSTVSDSADNNPNVCADTDGDTCDDCDGGSFDPADDGDDLDGDGLCNVGDPDIDDDGVGNASDPNDFDRFVCGDSDADTCDDCDGGSFDPANDGDDLDGDGLCNVGDPDIDGDGVGNAGDPDDFDSYVCGDSDADACDDCSVTAGPPDTNNDGSDQDNDGVCDATDACTDQDADGLGNGNLGNTACVNATVDSADNNPNVCADTDGDTCDDCDGGSFDPDDDGVDLDGDGLCNVGDPDIDGDGVGNASDPNDYNRFVCGDSDYDVCDDCSQTGGPPDAANDGTDTDGDGVCDTTDACTDQDTDGLGNGNLGNTACVSTVSDSADNNPNVCADTDGDTCDDCDGGSFDPADDGVDLDGDGLCNNGDPDIDGDGVGNAGDPDDYDRFVCGDSDVDTCDDCSQTGGPPDTNNDGSDRDSDGTCDAFDWYDTDWQWRIPISVNQSLVAGTLTDFPLLVSISGAAHLRDNALADPDDLVFTEGDGKTRLTAEIEEWAKASGDLLAWVRLPTISNTGGTSPELYLYYGYSGAAPLPTPPAASGVWDNDYRAVWHLDDDPSAGPAAIRDSTLYSNNGTAVGATGEWVVDDLVDAVVGQGTRFDHSSTYLNMGSDSSLDDLDPLTFEAWIYANSWGGGGYGRIVNKATVGGTRPFSLYCYGVSSELITFRERDTTELRVRTYGNVVALNAWFHVTLVVDTTSDTLRIYVNGTETSYDPGDTELGAGAAVSDAAENLLLGNNGLLDRYFDGILDEARLSSTTRSAAWIRTSYNTQVNPSIFLSFSSEQERPTY